MAQDPGSATDGAASLAADWDLVIRPHRHLLEVDLRALWEFRDLLSLFVKRDIITVYKHRAIARHNV